MIKIEVANKAEFLDGLKGVETRIARSFPDVINSVSAQLRGRIVTKLSGEVLNRRSGKLVSSVHTIAATRREGRIVGAVEAAGDNAWYGKVHEKGTTATYLRKTKHGAVRVTVTYPKKSFFRSSIRELRPVIKAMMAAALESALKG